MTLIVYDSVKDESVVLDTRILSHLSFHIIYSGLREIPEPGCSGPQELTGGHGICWPKKRTNKINIKQVVKSKENHCHNYPTNYTTIGLFDETVSIVIFRISKRILYIMFFTGSLQLLYLNYRPSDHHKRNNLFLKGWFRWVSSLVHLSPSFWDIPQKHI